MRREAKQRLLAGLVVVLAAIAVGCGSDDEAGAGTADLSWFIFNEPSGILPKVADECSQQSNGEYKISFEYLPNDADSQREQLVRRLGAEDSTIDLIGMDVIWTGEFANAGWLEPVPASSEQVVTENVFPSVLETANFDNQLYVVPIWSNTQLLWYRKDRVDQVPETWDEMIDQAEELGPAEGRIQVQANRYEGLTVWANAMVKSAGAEFIEGSGEDAEVALDEEKTKRALAVMGRLSNSPVAPAGITTSNEDSARLGFESGDTAFMVNYPFVFPSAKENAPEIFEQMGAAKFPKVDPSIESAPPLGGINLGVSKFSEDKEAAFSAIECLIQAENQLAIAEAGGLPPVRSDLYDRPEIEEIYPGFSGVIRDSIRDAAGRPSQTPAYQDLSLGIQRAVHPTTAIDPQSPDDVYQQLRDRVEQAINREGLL